MKENFCRQVDNLVRGIISPVRFVRTNHVSHQLIDRLELEATLEGHQGCVNCLEWNDRGTHLASSSDDCTLILWDPFECKKIFSMNTGHVGNVFSVKFLPTLNENLIVTGAADARIRVHDVSRAETRYVFTCHTGRIKRLANTMFEPFLFWSAAEDGTIRQFDLRDPDQVSKSKARNVLVDLHNYIGPNAEAKCLAFNPLRAEMLAVGSNDPYIRVYDRRKLTLSAVSQPARSRERRRLRPNASTGDNATNEDSCVPSLDSVRYFVPGHLPAKEVSHRTCFRSVHCTCVSFSPDGDQLLANLGGDHIYMFDLNKYQSPYCCNSSQSNLTSEGLTFVLARQPETIQLSPPITSSCLDVQAGARDQNSYSVRDRYQPCSMLENASLQAARLIKAKAFVAAIRSYNELIKQWPFDPQLYTGRATALLRRGWNGDVYGALRDCQTTLKLTESDCPGSGSIKGGKLGTLSPKTENRVRDCIRATAFLLYARCLLRLDWIQGVRPVLDQVQSDYRYLVGSHLSGSAAPDGAACLEQEEDKPKQSTKNATSSKNREPVLQKFFEILERELVAKEEKCAKAKEERNRKRADRKKTEDAENGSIEKKQTHTGSSSPVDSTTCQHPDPASSSQNREENGPDLSAAFLNDNSPTVFHVSGVHDHPDEDVGNEADEEWTPIWFSTRDSSSGNCVNPPDSCSCLGCVTSSTNYVNAAEGVWRQRSTDYTRRFIGHCNAITDIKEANFFGGNGQYIVGGSDCGSFFVWDSKSGNIVRILQADSSTVNCVQPHPSICLLASSGIDSVVRLWSPLSEDSDQTHVIKDYVGAAERNQRRSVRDPLESMLLNMGYRIPGIDNPSDRPRRSRRDRQSRTNHRSSSSSRPDDNVEPHTDVEGDLLDEDLDDEFDQSDDADEDYTNSSDLEGLPEIPGAAVHLGDDPDPERMDFSSVNGADQKSRIPESERVQERKNEVRSRGRGRGSQNAQSSRTRSKHKRLKTDDTFLQPSIACSAFDDDSTDDTDEESPENGGGYGTVASLIEAFTRTDSAPVNNTRSQASRRRRTSPFLALHSVLSVADRVFFYDNTSGDDSRRPTNRSRAANINESGNRAAENSEDQNNEDADSTVLQIPCTMS
ncbi:unnamed protein product [Calicophoron daubneyi]|uniref:WD and tetratricopeptide repeats protein 1 n=1 Tax=Calicophoron daubneyi TaxID=300641 RepID=A0AAV2TTS3_CALDB